jgi:hypothetical protein
MAFLKTLTRDVETPQFLKEVGFLHGKHDLRFQYALDGEWYTLPRCMRTSIPSKWEVLAQDPPEPVYQKPAQIDECRPFTPEEIEFFEECFRAWEPKPQAPAPAYQPSPDRQLGPITYSRGKLWHGDPD